jgi:hypothetical protein
MIGEGEQIIDRYLMWEYHGALECDEIAILLRAMGRTRRPRSTRPRTTTSRNIGSSSTSARTSC